MRWKGLLFIFVLVGIGLVISGLSIDGWLESGLEKAGQAVVGARVEIDGLDFRPLALSLQWDRLQITDPNNTMQNVLETGRTAFQMNPAPLLRKRVIIQEMAMADVRSGTARDSDGALPKRKVPKEKEDPSPIERMSAKLTAQIEQLPVMQFDPKTLKGKINVDSLMALADLQTIDRVDSVKHDAVRTAEKWQAFYAGFHPEAEIQKIREDFINIDIEKIKTVPEIIAFLEKVQSARTTFSGISDTVLVKHREIHHDVNKLVSYKKHMTQWVEEDYHRLLEHAKLPDISSRNIGKILFGKALMSQMDKYLHYYQLLRKVIPPRKDKPKKEKRPRLAGQTIHFPDRNSWPAFLIEKVFLTGVTGDLDDPSGLTMSGEARGITSQPDVYGKAAVIHLRGERSDRRTASFRAVLDHTTEATSDSFTLSISQIPMNGVSLLENDRARLRINRANVDFKGTSWVGEDAVEVALDVTIRQVDYDFSQFPEGELFYDVIKDVLSQISFITIHSELTHEGDVLDFQLRSNVDNRISQELQRMVSQTLSETQNRIRTSLYRIRDEKRIELESYLSDRIGIIQGPIDDYKSQVDEIQMGIDEKIDVIEKEIEKKKREEGDKLKDLLKDVFKKKKVGLKL